MSTNLKDRHKVVRMKEMENGDDERIDTAYVFNWLQLRMGKGEKREGKKKNK